MRKERRPAQDTALVLNGNFITELEQRNAALKRRNDELERELVELKKEIDRAAPEPHESQRI